MKARTSTAARRRPHGCSTGTARQHRSLRRAVATSLAAALLSAGALAPQPAWARVPSPAALQEPAPTAADLFREGQADAAAADFAGAIEHFEAAMRLVAHDADAVGVRNRMRTELVLAHIKAYDVDGDATHLSKASVLLDDYAHDLEAGQEVEKTWVEERRADLESRRQKAAAAAAAATDSDVGEETDQTDQTDQTAPAAEDPTTPPPASVDPNRDARARSARTLMFSGGLLTGVGVVGGALSIAGFSIASSAVDTFRDEPNERDDAATRNRNGNTMGIAGGVVAGIAIPVGVALLVVGAKRKKAAQAVSVVPYFDAGTGPTHARSAGLTLSGKF